MDISYVQMKQDDVVKKQKQPISNSWRSLSLEDAVNIYDKQRKPLNETQRQKMEGQYPYCGANGIVDHLNDYLFDGEYVLLAEDGGYWGAFETSAYLMKGKFWVNNHAHILQAKPKIADNSFLTYLFIYLDITPYINGTTRGKLTQGVMQKIPIHLPPLSVQKAIAKVLQIIQETIRVRQKELKLENERKASLMEYIFTHGIYNEPRKQTEIGEIPQSWQVLELGHIITLHRGYDLPNRDRKSGAVPIISSSGFSGTHSEAKVAGPGVVTGRYGTIGEVFYIEQDFWPLNTTLYVSEYKNVIPNFVANLLRTLNFNMFNDKSSVPGVNRNDLHRIKVRLPSLTEQQEIVNILSSCDPKINALKQEITLLEELFSAFLEELMTGRLSTLPLIEEGERHE
jgi:type I restriction enzyme, S subunit